MNSNRPTPLRLGILGCANIARQFARDVAPSRLVHIAAVASRDAAKAAAFATEFGIGRTHGSYDALLADSELDAVYIPLPNSLHAQWAVRAAQHGRHVLCEKPLAMSLRRSVHDVRCRAPARRDAARGLPVVVPAADGGAARPAARWCHRQGAHGADGLRLHAARPRRHQHPLAARIRRRRVARRRQLHLEPDSPGDGPRAAARARQRAPGAQRRGHRHHRHAGVCRRRAWRSSRARWTWRCTGTPPSWAATA